MGGGGEGWTMLLAQALAQSALPSRSRCANESLSDPARARAHAQCSGGLSTWWPGGKQGPLASMSDERQRRCSPGRPSSPARGLQIPLNWDKS